MLKIHESRLIEHQLRTVVILQCHINCDICWRTDIFIIINNIFYQSSVTTWLGIVYSKLTALDDCLPVSYGVVIGKCERYACWAITLLSNCYGNARHYYTIELIHRYLIIPRYLTAIVQTGYVNCKPH